MGHAPPDDVPRGPPQRGPLAWHRGIGPSAPQAWRWPAIRAPMSRLRRLAGTLGQLGTLTAWYVVLLAIGLALALWAMP